MQRPYLSSAQYDFKQKAVLVRIDCDVDVREKAGRLVVDDDFRLTRVLPTIEFLLEKEVGQVIMLGHIGRPDGVVVDELKLKPVADWLAAALNSRSPVVEVQLKGKAGYRVTERLFLLENLRFDAREKANDQKYARELAGLGEVYVNEAFGVSHRQHASIVGIPQLLPAFLGLNIEREVENIIWLKSSAPRPIVVVLGGSKEDKVGYLTPLSAWADWLLVGGKLPILVGGERIGSNVLLAKLNESGTDISEEAVGQFKKVLAKAATLVWAGPMGRYEQPGSARGTTEIAQAIGAGSAKKFAGGGDTHRIIGRLDLWDKFDFVSVGGGAMLSYLTAGELAGLQEFR